MPEDAAHTRDAPLAPDFATHDAGPPVERLEATPTALRVVWSDGLEGRFNRYWLRENEVVEGVVSPVTRERELSLLDIPVDLALVAAERHGTSGLFLTWAPDDRVTRHSLGWLRSAAEGHWKVDHALPAQTTWDASDMPEPVSFDGTAVLTDDSALTEWLRATHRYGLARLRGLPDQEGLVQRVAERIGTVRASNFGFLFTVESKPDPDSTAYTSVALEGHTDLPSREVQPGLQMLHCRENTCSDGFSTMVDGFRLAEVLRDSDPDAFDALTTLNWIWSNRHRDSDYRWSAPVFSLDRAGAVTEIRGANFLRADPDMPDQDIERAYRAYRLMSAMAADPAFVCRYPFSSGDLVVFDNRRVLHGRDSFDPNGGVRRLQGCYLDRDELHSRLRILARQGH